MLRNVISGRARAQRSRGFCAFTTARSQDVQTPLLFRSGREENFSFAIRCVQALQGFAEGGEGM